jgi:hypothetical protein
MGASRKTRGIGVNMVGEDDGESTETKHVGSPGRTNPRMQVDVKHPQRMCYIYEVQKRAVIQDVRGRPVKRQLAKPGQRPHTHFLQTQTKQIAKTNLGIVRDGDFEGY